MLITKVGTAAVLLLIACGASVLDTKGESAVASRSVDPVLEMKADGGDLGMQDVVGLAVRADSTVVVGDAAAAQILHFATDGHVLSRSGRKGSLINEYQRLQWVGMCDDSDLYVHDIALSRLSLLDGSLKATSFRSIPKVFDSRDVAGCLPASRVLILNDSNPYRVHGVYRRPLSLVRFDIKTGKADTIRRFAGPQINFVAKLGTWIAVPMGERTHVAVTDGRVLVAESNLDSLWRFDGTNWHAVALENIPAAEAPSAADDERARLALGWAPRTPQDRAFAPALLRETATAKLAPRIDGLAANSDGSAWVALKPDASGRRTWVGYDSLGRKIGTTNFSWTFEPRVVRGATWWGVERDSIGVETVVRYRVPQN